MNQSDLQQQKNRRRKRVVVSAVLLSLVFIFALVWIFGVGASRMQPTISRDYVAELDAVVESVPVEQRAWPRLRDGLVQLRSAAHATFTPDEVFEPSSGERLSEFAEIASTLHPLASEFSDSDEYPVIELSNLMSTSSLSPEVVIAPSDIRAFFGEQQAVIGSMRDACQLPLLGAPYGNFDVVPEDPQERDFYYTPRMVSDLEVMPQDTGIYSNSMLTITSLHLAPMREVTRLFASDAALAVEAGDGARATDDLIAMLELGQLGFQDSFLISQLVANGVRSLAVQLMEKFLTEHAEVFSEDDLARLAEVLAGPLGVVKPISMDGERMFIEDFVQRSYTDDGSGNGVLILDGLRSMNGTYQFGTPLDGMPDMIFAFIRPGLGWLAPSRKEVLAQFGEIEAAYDAAAEQPPWESDYSEYLQAQARAAPTGPNPGLLASIRSFPFSFLGASYERTISVTFELAVMFDVVRSIVALVRYERDHDMWPESLEALLPTYLSSLPLDPCDGKPLRYAVRSGRPILWSIGQDRIDNAGQQPAEGDDPAIADDQDAAAKPVFGDPAPGLIVGEDWILWRGPRVP